ncbi:hypothetical protein [Hymenobacter edaphi]|uniref:DUF3379 domain-containing protein n=1 Tax=Hymenobacter edaphi TaxID=2211146 RepID=A0A328BYB4_9BACT|nr:hypothetical protein [Hymenobacter edaphi]RAK70128.1 hypothetical protein DLM85_04555 [Hymenobacter edaphi]
MQPEDIDKLFRAKLEQHATPPPPSLWYDLQEQLEPEEKKRRGGFWMAIAAAITLLLVAGGSWLVWQHQPLGPGNAGPLASGTTTGGPGQPRPAEAPATTTPTAPSTPADADFGVDSTVRMPLDPATIAARPAAAPTAEEAAKNSANPAATQATVTPRPASTHQQQQLLARTERAAAPRTSDRPEKPVFQPTDEHSVADVRQAVAAQPAPAQTTASLTPAAPAGAPSLPAGAIEVEVRQHPEQAVALAPAAAAEAPGRTRPSVRGVLRQMRRVAQGEKPNLAEVGLPTNPALTLQARVAGHTLTKTISL